MTNWVVEYGMVTDSSKPAIQGVKLQDSDIGKAVFYVPEHSRIDENGWEKGIISSFKAGTGKVWVRFAGPNGALCIDSQLRWAEEAKLDLKSI